VRQLRLLSEASTMRKEEEKKRKRLTAAVRNGEVEAPAADLGTVEGDLYLCCCGRWTLAIVLQRPPVAVAVKL
jgi:hypothetical protein